MEKQKRWQFILILAVILLTIYNILPTIFFYSKPLTEHIDAKHAHEIAFEASERVNQLEPDSIAWLHSFSKLIGVKPTSIALSPQDPRQIDVTFNSTHDSELFERFLPRAGALIP